MGNSRQRILPRCLLFCPNLPLLAPLASRTLAGLINLLDDRSGVIVTALRGACRASASSTSCLFAPLWLGLLGLALSLLLSVLRLLSRFWAAFARCSARCTFSSARRSLRCAWARASAEEDAAAHPLQGRFVRNAHSQKNEYRSRRGRAPEHAIVGSMHGDHPQKMPRKTGWCRIEESNPRPSHYKCAALPTELIRHERNIIAKGSTRRMTRARVRVT